MSKEFLIDVGEQLSFSQPKQDAILGHLLMKDSFFLQSVDKMSPDWFIDRNAGRIYRAKVDFYKAHGKVATVEEVKNLQEFVIEEAKVRNSLHTKIDLAVHIAGEISLDPLLGELTDWMHSRMFYVGMHKAAQLYNAKQPRKAIEHVQSISKVIADTSFQEDQQERFDHPKEHVEKQKEELENSCTFGNSIVDERLNPHAKNGALLRGDTTILLAPVNIGKTTVTITVIRHNLLRGKPVLWLIHEGRTDDLKTKMWQALLDVSQERFFEMALTLEGQAHIAKVQRIVDRFLTFIPMHKPGLTVEEVGRVIERYQEERVRKHGTGYALVVDDYPAKLMTEHGGRWERRQVDHYTYNFFVQMALDMKFHAFLPIQSNREGSRINNGTSKQEERLLHMEDVSESFGTMQVATNVISYNRDAQAEAKNRGTFYICKSRSNTKGWAICCTSNFAHSITHSNDLGATWYRGSSTMADRIDELMVQHRDAAVPEMAF